MRHMIRQWGVGLGTLALLTSALAADEDSYFRRDGGVATGSAALPDNFSDGARQLWRTPLLPGHSSPCLVGDRIFLTTYDEGEQELATVALDRSSGEVLWRRAVPTERIEEYHPTGSPASCTPASDGERVYVFFGSYGLLCYDLEGKLLWSREMGPFQDEFGASSSPVIVDGHVILNEDHDVDSFIIALDAETGETVWKTEREGFTRSYSTPIVWRGEGRTQVIVAGALQLAAYEVKSGRKVWWVDGLSRIVDSTPSMTDGLVYVATWTPGGDAGERISMEPFSEALKQFDRDGDGKIALEELPEGEVRQRFFRIDLNQDGKLDEEEWNKHARVFELAQNAAMAIRPAGEGDITHTAVQWTYHRGLPTVPSSVVYDGVMYMVKDSGIITSLDAKTGQLLKQGRAAGTGNYYASIVAGDGKVYLASEGGVVTVLEAGRDWQILSAHDFDERILATPVMKDGTIYLRTDDALYCFTRS
jgi:outer membrane protein assembly factor BamB